MAGTGRALEWSAVFLMVAASGCQGAVNGLADNASALTSVKTVQTKMTGTRCLDISGGSHTPGTPAQIWDCNGTAAQQVDLLPTGEMKLYDDALCLDASGGRGLEGDPIIVWPCNGGANQKWTFDGSTGTIKGINGLCLDVRGANPTAGTQLEIWSCNGGANQAWTETDAGGTTDPSPPPPTPPPSGGGTDTQPSGSISVASYGAHGDGADQTAAIRSAIAAAGDGQVVWLPAGSYGISGLIDLPASRTLQGAASGSTLKSLNGTQTLINITSNDTVDRLVLDGGQLTVSGDPASNVTVTNNTIRNINLSSCPQPYWCPASSGLFVWDGVVNSRIEHNAFSNIWTTVNLGDPNDGNSYYYEQNGITVGIGLYYATNTSISFNAFDHVVQGIKIYERGGTVCNSVTIDSNVMTAIHRIGIETQCGSGNGITYSNNYMTDFFDPWWGTAGLSSRDDGMTGIVADSNVFVSYATPHGWYLGAMEMIASSTLTIQNNFAYGYWDNSIMFGTDGQAGGRAVVTGNVYCQSHQGAGSLHYEYASCSDYSGGCPSGNDDVSGNPYFDSCSSAPALPAPPGAGPQ